MTLEHSTSVGRQRDLTFRYNADLGRHGWLRLTPAYSVKVVETIVRQERVEKAVFDPFSGTATTTLAAVNQGLPAFSTDINPFLVWLGSLKTARFSARQLELTRAAMERAIELLESGHATAVSPPPIHDIDRWWEAPRLDFLRRLKGSILESTRVGTAARSLLLVAFCRTMIGLSNAAFNHQSMSFKPASGGPSRGVELARRFRDDGETVIRTAALNPPVGGRVLLDDARELAAVARRGFDVLVTSPPYPNRMSYIRELRPYMYWLGYLEAAREAGELDWAAIGGTWGVATSRLSGWQPPAGGRLPRFLGKVVRDVERSGAPHARLLSLYLAKYFHDMRQHLGAVAARVAPGGRVHYIVGNSVFYGVLVPSERAYGELLAEQGFRDVQVRVLRKRNSKKELFEFDVTGTKGP